MGEIINWYFTIRTLCIAIWLKSIRTRQERLWRLELCQCRMYSRDRLLILYRYVKQTSNLSYCSSLSKLDAELIEGENEFRADTLD